MESFLVAVNAVVPFLCYITFGYVMKIKGVVKEDFLQQLNKMVFKVFYPFMTFYNIYKADASSLPRPVMLIFCGVSILVLEVILVLTVPRLVKENPRRGVIIQAIYRSNFVLFGLPLTVSVFGDVASSVAAMVVTVVITIYNTTSVVILEMFNSEGKTDVKTILVNVVKNPLLQGAVVGLLFFFLGIHVPKSLLTPIAAFADATSPVALFVLGGTLPFQRHPRQHEIPGTGPVLKAPGASCGDAGSGLRLWPPGSGAVPFGGDLRNAGGRRLLSHGPEYGRRRRAGWPVRGHQHRRRRWDPVWVDLLYEERGTDLVHLLQYDIFDPASVQDEGAVFRLHIHRKIRAEAEDVFSGCVPVKL